MKKKRILPMAMSMLMVVSLVACGNQSDETTTGGDASTKAEVSDGAETSGGDAAPASADDDKVITYWDAAVEDPDASIMKYAVDQFNANTKSGYRVELTSIQNDKYKEKLVIAMSSGECPDMYTSWAGGPLQEYIESGYGQPITELYKEAGLDQKYMDAATAEATFNGEIYGIPILNCSVSGVFYNKEIFDKYGLSEPSTIAELEAICEKLKENGITPFTLANSTKWQGSMYYQGLATRYAGVKDFRAAYDGSGSFDAECFKYAGEKIQDWVKKGYFPEGVNSLSTDDGQDKQLLYQGKAAMLYSGSWYAAAIKTDSEEFYKKIGWFPFPENDAVPNGAEYLSICNGTIGDQFISFNCTGDKLKAAVELASYYSSAEAIQLMVDKGKIPPVNGVKEMLSDPITKEICDYVESASDVQLWYDQFLPASVANAHLDSCQELFGLSMTSQEACDATQKAMTEYLEDKR